MIHDVRTSETCPEDVISNQPLVTPDDTAIIVPPESTSSYRLTLHQVDIMQGHALVPLVRRFKQAFVHFDGHAI